MSLDKIRLALKEYEFLMFINGAIALGELCVYFKIVLGEYNADTRFYLVVVQLLFVYQLLLHFVLKYHASKDGAYLSNDEFEYIAMPDEQSQDILNNHAIIESTAEQDSREFNLALLQVAANGHCKATWLFSATDAGSMELQVPNNGFATLILVSKREQGEQPAIERIGRLFQKMQQSGVDLERLAAEGL